MTDSSPYPELGKGDTATATNPPVFITGRFRSGSTLLWNLFRRVAGCTAFYEPLNERQWFDASIRGERIDSTHLGVTDYWREYEGLTSLGQYYRRDWIDRNLYMPARFWDPELYNYVATLVAAAQHTAVLQFNRVDFRLPWLRHNFTNAKLIHLYRHPRDQWCSSLVDIQAVPKNISATNFDAYDQFYLLPWARDLSYHFPFLDPRTADHPYDLFYYIWKLSYLFGRKYCHGSFCFETLCQSPDIELQRLMQVSSIRTYDLNELRKLVVPQKSKWSQYADQSWFAEREGRCEVVLSRFLE
jgi:hypothetical protein